MYTYLLNLNIVLKKNLITDRVAHLVESLNNLQCKKLNRCYLLCYSRNIS